MIKTNILIECETYVQTAIEMYEIFKLFEKFGKIKVRIKLTSNIKKSDIEWCDILYSIRSENLFSTYLAQLCKRYGRMHIVLLDDYLFIHERKDLFMKKRQLELGKILNITDVLFSSNQLLIDRIKKDYRVSKAVRIDTAVEGKDIIKSKINSLSELTKKIVYYSNDGTNICFEKVMIPILDIISQEDIEYEVHCIGMQKLDEYDKEQYNIRYVPHMSLKDFRKYLTKTGFTIGLAPLVGNDGFSEYKYFNKFIEFSMAGIPGIYSNIYPYNSIIKNGKNGFLCADKSEWVDKILLLLHNPNLAFDIANNAQEQLRSEFNLEKIYNHIIEQLPEFHSYKAPEKEISILGRYKIKYYIFCFLEKINSVYRVLRNKGVGGLIRRSRQYFMLKYQTQPKYWNK